MGTKSSQPFSLLWWAYQLMVRMFVHTYQHTYTLLPHSLDLSINHTILIHRILLTNLSSHPININTYHLALLTSTHCPIITLPIVPDCVLLCPITTTLFHQTARHIMGKLFPMQWVENLAPNYGLVLRVDHNGR